FLRPFPQLWCLMQLRLVPLAAGTLAAFLLLATVSCRRAAPVTEVHTPVTAESAAPNLAAALPAVDARVWPWWRGPGRDGIAIGPAPTEWTATRNIVWKTTVPGRGHSSPTIWGNQIFF